MSAVVINGCHYFGFINQTHLYEKNVEIWNASKAAEKAAEALKEARARATFPIQSPDSVTFGTIVGPFDPDYMQIQTIMYIPTRDAEDGVEELAGFYDPFDRTIKPRSVIELFVGESSVIECDPHKCDPLDDLLDGPPPFVVHFGGSLADAAHQVTGEKSDVKKWNEVIAVCVGRSSEEGVETAFGTLRGKPHPTHAHKGILRIYEDVVKAQVLAHAPKATQSLKDAEKSQYFFVKGCKGTHRQNSDGSLYDVRNCILVIARRYLDASKLAEIQASIANVLRVAMKRAFSYVRQNACDRWKSDMDANSAEIDRVKYVLYYRRDATPADIEDAKNQIALLESKRLDLVRERPM